MSRTPMMFATVAKPESARSANQIPRPVGATNSTAMSA